jgi:antitoxin FitA
MISLISTDFGVEFLEGEMADLLVRGIDEDLVRALKERAGAHGRSAEAEHREILAAALARPRRRSFAEVLASMPEVGADADFERRGSSGRARDVFD